MNAAPRSPLLIRVAVVVQCLLLVMAFGFLLDAPLRRALLAGLVLLVQLAALAGVWRMKTWGVWVYGLALLVNMIQVLVMHSAEMTSLLDSALAILLTRGFVLIPVVFYRRSFR